MCMVSRRFVKDEAVREGKVSQRKWFKYSLLHVYLRGQG